MFIIILVNVVLFLWMYFTPTYLIIYFLWFRSIESGMRGGECLVDGYINKDMLIGNEAGE
jgi:hypothetical protein